MTSRLRLWWQKSRLRSTLRSWWEQIQKYRRAIGVVAIVLVVVVVIALIIIVVLSNGIGINGYNKVSTVHTISGPSAGTVTRTEEYQPGKTLWDLLQLLIVPVVLAIAGFWLNRIQKSREERAAEQRDKTERGIAKDNQCETALQEYIDKMSELLLDKNLRKSAEDDELRKIARVLTLTVLSKLDASRKRSVMQFLYESDLINKSDPSSETECIVHLHATDRNRSNGADLSGADLSGLPLAYSDLHKVNLSKANLNKASLSEADLSEANLSEANLREALLSWGKVVIDPTGANLKEAVLSEADLSGAIMNDVILIDADLSGAKLSDADLSGANLTGVTGITVEELERQTKSLKGATMPNGLKRP
jgi:uncharacterized protein YjbI with pentapeptide repeats